LLNSLAAEDLQSHPWLRGTGIHASAASTSIAQFSHSLLKKIVSCPALFSF
jgi:hypothetical protein